MRGNETLTATDYKKSNEDNDGHDNDGGIRSLRFPSDGYGIIFSDSDSRSDSPCHKNLSP
jgi:hypothetical protein